MASYLAFDTDLLRTRFRHIDKNIYFHVALMPIPITVLASHPTWKYLANDLVPQSGSQIMDTDQVFALVLVTLQLGWTVKYTIEDRQHHQTREPSEIQKRHPILVKFKNSYDVCITL